MRSWAHVAYAFVYDTEPWLGKINRVGSVHHSINEKIAQTQIYVQIFNMHANLVATHNDDNDEQHYNFKESGSLNFFFPLSLRLKLS